MVQLHPKYSLTQKHWLKVVGVLVVREIQSTWVYLHPGLPLAMLVQLVASTPLALLVLLVVRTLLVMLMLLVVLQALLVVLILLLVLAGNLPPHAER